MPNPRRTVPALIVGLSLAALCACTTRTDGPVTKYIGGHVVLDSNRVLLSAVKKTEYDLQGFMLSKDGADYETRMFVVDIRKPGVLGVLKTTWNSTLWDEFADSAGAMLSSWSLLDPAADKIFETGFDYKKPARPAKMDYANYGKLLPGPRPGRYLAEIEFHGESSPGITGWYVYDWAGKTYTFLADNAERNLIDVAYRGGQAWGMYRNDSLSVRLRRLDDAGPGRVISLPDTLSEWEAEAEFALGGSGLWILFICGHCPGEASYRYLDAAADSAVWIPKPVWSDFSLLHELAVEPIGNTGSVRVFHTRGNPDTSAYDLSPWLH